MMKNEPVDVHTWFSLSYSSYFVMPRSVLQAMPEAWQHKFTSLVDELNETFDWMPEGAERYSVHLRAADSGRFVHDPRANYRHPNAIPRRQANPPREALKAVP